MSRWTGSCCAAWAPSMTTSSSKAWNMRPGEELRFDGGGPAYLLKRVE